MKTLNPNNRNPRYEGLPFDALHELLMDACDGVARPNVRVGVGNHTTAEFLVCGHDDPQPISIRYHDTQVAVIWDNDAVMLNNGGYKTKSTKTRMDWCILPIGYRLTSVGRTWKVYSIKTGAYKDFHNGMIVAKDEF